MRYKLIVVDPPWPVRKIERRVRPNQKPELDYKTMSVDEIKRLPIREIAAENSACFLWTTHAFLETAFKVLRAWGFKYQRTMTWDKGDGMTLFGFHHRSEFVLMGYRGKIEIYQQGKAIPTVFFAPSKRHSEKPDEFYHLVEHIGEPRIDVFARRRRPGWDAFGDEVEGSITLRAGSLIAPMGPLERK